ncbi:hypothetical protein KHP62_02240 [Rhodobacteraceae bacterium NNCM2]|nr:hypothetical protein [Coraliihabitans acroporae]
MATNSVMACAAGLALAAGTAFASDNPDQPAIDACIDALQTSGKASAPGGMVLNSSFSEAGTEVILEDGGGTVWRCIAYSDGSVSVLEKATADEAEAARAAPKLSDFQERVRFKAGTNSATLTRTLEPGDAFQFLLGASSQQFLRVRVTPHSGKMYYHIQNPDGSSLLDGTDSATDYYGQLWQSGEHLVEVVNESDQSVTYDIFFAVE